MAYWKLDDEGNYWQSHKTFDNQKPETQSLIAEAIKIAPDSDREYEEHEGNKRILSTSFSMGECNIVQELKYLYPMTSPAFGALKKVNTLVTYKPE